MIKKALFVAACALAFAPALYPGGIGSPGGSLAHAKPAPPQPNGPGSKAITDDILDAIAEEMNRQMTQLEIPGQPKPYLITYKITEVDVNDVAASLGQTTSKRNRHFVNLEARVRVGTPAFDNSNYVVPQAEEIDAVQSINLPLEATPRIARRATWLVTDAAYKEALMQLRAKLEARRTGGVRQSDVPAWTTEKPVVSEQPVLVPALESLDELETRAKAVSAVFRDAPQIRDSRVAITSYLERRWYVSSEGSNVTDTRRASGIVVVAHGQAEDGEGLAQYFLRYGTTAKDLPSDDELKTESKKLSQQIADLMKAPVLDPYRGPVLFEGEGAVGLIRFILAPHLGGTPVPEGLDPREARTFGGAFAGAAVDQRIISPMLSIHDDPTARVGNGKSLIGGYKIDDEGVVSQKVDVIKDGKLKTLLTSRTPTKKGQLSNGHARRTANGGAFHGSATNLFVSGRGGVPRAQLTSKLIAATKADGLKYGILIRRMDDGVITAAPDFSRRELVQMVKSADVTLPPPAILAYRVYPNGKQELVRGFRLGDIPPTAFEDVLGVSNEVTTYNFLAAADSQIQSKINIHIGINDEGWVPSAGIESAVITPDILLKRVQVGGSIGGERPVPVTPKPGK